MTIVPGYWPRRISAEAAIRRPQVLIGNVPARLAPYNGSMRYGIFLAPDYLFAAARARDRACSAFKSDLTHGPAAK